MPSWQARLVARLVRWRVKPALGDMRDIARVRRAFGQAVPPPRGARFTPATVGGVAGEWVTPANGPTPSDTLLYLHGGGFVGCSPRTHRPATAGLALRGWRVFVPDYRLAPEHPYPAALDDCRAVWRALVAEQAAGQAGQPATAHDTGTASTSSTSGARSAAPFAPPGRLTVAGDSAGGNLCLALMLAERDAGGRLPDAAALFSPAADLTGGSASIRDNAERDAMFHGEALGHLADAYLQGADPAQPLASPLLGRLDGLPPLLLHVGEDECLRDDALRLAVRARAAGVTVALQVWATVPHVWQLIRWLPEARASLDIAARFLRAPQAEAGAQPQDEVLDALIVGAGLSGIGQAAHLQQACPEQRYAILEARPRPGGTWDLFRYPGVRSDSDMYTLGYAFKPWTNPKAIADGPSIKAYIEETARERGIDAQIRCGHRAVAADWSSAEARWRVTVDVTPPTADTAAAPDRSHAGIDSGSGPGPAPTSRTIHTRFLLMCGGYYRYAQGHRPEWPGEADFQGRLVHPQAWPEDLDYRGKQVVIIGSGATAVTLLPEMAKDAAHVVMLQRSPTYIVTLPGQDPVAHWLERRLGTVLGPMARYRLVRIKNILLGMLLFQLARRWPDKAQARLLGLARQQLPPGADIARDYTPRYKPWDQRVCAVPDGDLFQAVRAGRASVVTDTIERFTPDGIRLASGRVLPADIVVTATGLALNALGDMAITIDGRPLAPASTMAYKGMMFSGVPNLVQTFGYTNASWTLKADLTADFTCRLIRHMARHGHAAATPQRDPAVGEAPFLDFSSGYVQRALATLPKQGDRKPWRLYQNYLLDWLTLRWGRVDDGHLQFTPAPPDRR